MAVECHLRFLNDFSMIKLIFMTNVPVTLKGISRVRSKTNYVILEKEEMRKEKNKLHLVEDLSFGR